MKSWIKIEYSEDGEYQEDCFGYFYVTIYHGEMKFSRSFYHDCSAWQDFGQELSDFPKTSDSTVTFEMVSSRLWLQAYCYNPQGHTALRVRVEKQGPDPDKSKFEFSIPAEAASLNQLGRLLAGWPRKDNIELQWQAQTS